MPVPETLCHPFATAKIVVTPATWSVIAGPIIVARSRDACSNTTLRACRRRGERTSDRCDRDEGNECLIHSRAPLQMKPSVSGRSKPNTRSSPKKSQDRQCCDFQRGGQYAEAIDATRLVCVDGARPRDRRTTQDTKKFPPLHVHPQQAIVSGQLSALIGAGFELLVAKS